MMDADLPAGNSRIDNQIIQFPLHGLDYQEYNKDFYESLFEAKNYSVVVPYVREFSRGIYGRKSFFSIRQFFMWEDAVNRVKDKAYSAMESDRYRGELPRFKYEIYTLIYKNNLRLLSRN